MFQIVDWRDNMKKFYEFIGNLIGAAVIVGILIVVLLLIMLIIVGILSLF